MTHAAGADDEDLVPFGTLVLGGGRGGGGMTQVKEGGGTVGLEQAAMVGWSGAGRGACIAGEGRQEGGEADHDERVECLERRWRRRWAAGLGWAGCACE